MEQLDGEARWLLYEGHLRRFTQGRAPSDRIRDALDWVIADLGSVAVLSGLAGLANSVRSKHPSSISQWAWRWVARTDAGTGLTLALICDGKTLAIAASLHFEAKPALEALAALDYEPVLDYGSATAYTLVRPVGPREDASRQGARAALADILRLSIASESLSIPDNLAGL